MFIHSTHYANRLELILLTLKTGVGVVGQICLQHHLSLFVMVDQNHLITLYETISAQHYLLNIFMNQDAKCKRKTAFFGTYLVRQITILWQEATAIWWRIRKRRYIIVFWHEILSATPCKLRVFMYQNVRWDLLWSITVISADCSSRSHQWLI